MKKFNRQYILKIITQQETITIRNLDLTFNSKKSVNPELNSASVNIFNLNESHRNILLHSETDMTSNIKVELYVGYEEELMLLFSGNLKSGVLSYDGTTFTNSLTIFDGGYDHQISTISKVVTSKKEFINSICDTFTEVKKGKIVVGNSYNEIKKIISPEEQFFISDNLLYVIKRDEVLNGNIPVIKSDTGLLGLPTIDKENVKFKCLLQTDIHLAGAVKLESKYMPSINGFYKVNEISTTGATDGGDWSMEIVGLRINNLQQL